MLMIFNCTLQALFREYLYRLRCLRRAVKASSAPDSKPNPPDFVLYLHLNKDVYPRFVFGRSSFHNLLRIRGDLL